MATLKLLATRRDGTTQLLELALPLTFGESALNDVSSHSGFPYPLWSVQDACDTEYFFRKDDGTYDGWGRVVACNEEAEQLLQHASSSKTPPKVEIN